MIPRPLVARLEAAGIPDAAGDVRRLFEEAYAAGNAPGAPAQTREAPNEVTLEMLSIFLEQRLARMPVAQIIGRRAFWRHEFRVTPDVLDPRPETETLVAAALERPFTRILDLGTGSGCILLSLLVDRPASEGLGTDLSPAALSVAAWNARELGLAGRARFAEGPWFAPVEGRFDLIVSNPPYIPAADLDGLAPEVRDHEPRGALTDGADGLSAYRAIFAGAAAHLAPGGRVLVEFGAGQGDDVARIAAAEGWQDTSFHADLDGRDRVLAALSPGSRGF
ncbi:MAG: peptide chain release factor N(5)-glutamine methyltransferase [Pseudomonadota bacterium]